MKGNIIIGICIISSFLLISLPLISATQSDDIEVNIKGGIGLKIEIINKSNETVYFNTSTNVSNILGFQIFNANESGTIIPNSDYKTGLNMCIMFAKGHAIVECSEIVKETDFIIIGFFVILL